MKIFVQHMATTKEVEINANDNLAMIKNRIADKFEVDSRNIVLMLNSRTLSSEHLTAADMDIGESTRIVLKIINRPVGSKGGNIKDLMNAPGVKSMLKNPLTVKMMKSMFKKDEASEDNETMRMLMNSEGFEDEMDKMAQGGEYLNTQLRNVDLAMAKLENMPGGMNIMSSMFKDVEDPLKKLKGETKYEGGFKTNEAPTERLSFNNKNINYELLYRREIKSLEQNGFTTKDDNLWALIKAEGNVDLAIEFLLEKYDSEQ